PSSMKITKPLRPPRFASSAAAIWRAAGRWRRSRGRRKPGGWCCWNFPTWQPSAPSTTAPNMPKPAPPARLRRRRNSSCSKGSTSRAGRAGGHARGAAATRSVKLFLKRREIGVNRRVTHLFQRRRVPGWCLVLVDDRRARSLVEVRALYDAAHHAELHAHAVIKLELQAATQLLMGEFQAGRRLGFQRRRGEERAVISGGFEACDNLLHRPFREVAIDQRALDGDRRAWRRA